MNLKRNGKGFTLIELIIIIIILGILAAVAIPKYLDMRQDAVNSTVKGVLGGIRGANSVLWGNRVINNYTTTYSFADLIANMELKGANMTWDVSQIETMTLTVGSSSYSFTMGVVGQAATYAQPPTTYPQIFGNSPATAQW